MSRYVRVSLVLFFRLLVRVFSAFSFSSDLGRCGACLVVVVVVVVVVQALCSYVTIDWRSSGTWEVLCARIKSVLLLII